MPGLTENSTWSGDCGKHARYMVKNNYIGHDEVPTNQWFTPEGLAAGQSSNVNATSTTSTTDINAIDLWMYAPFHGIGILDPAFLQTGYNSYREQTAGWQFAACLDVIRGRGPIPNSVTFPVMWPANNKTVTQRTFNGFEYPDPLTSCPGYTVPTGMPIYLQLGSTYPGGTITASSFKQGSTTLESCVFDGLTYTNPDANSQVVGRATLSPRGAIIMMPKKPLTAGATYTVSITASAQTYTWSFQVSPSAALHDAADKPVIVP